MKKILLSITLCMVLFCSYGQSIISRSGGSVTVVDSNLFVGKSFRLPVFNDTTVANLAHILDSAGRLIYTYTGNAFYIRYSNPKRWVAVGSGGGGGSVNSVSGTANRITSSGGTDPVIDISGSYTGQTSIVTLGSIVTGVWNSTAISALKGGTGQTGYTTGDILYASSSSALSKLPIGTTKQTLHVFGGVPVWRDTFALSLTTTGSSGAATLTGGVLNIPQYTGGGGTTDTTYLITTVATIPALENTTTTASQVWVSDTLRGGLFYYTTATSIPDSGTIFPANGKGSGYWKRNIVYGQKLNVAWWGVKPDNSTDWTSTYALIMTKAYRDSGAHAIYWPSAGIYLGTIKIPKTSKWFYITLEGSGMPSMLAGTVSANSLPNAHSTILKSTSTTDTAVIRAELGDFGGFSFMSAYIKNMEIRTYDNPQIDGINMKYAQDIKLENVFVNTGVYSVQASEPTNLRSGVVAPQRDNGAICQLDNVTVTGYYVAFDMWEHFSAGEINSFCNYIGLRVNEGFHENDIRRFGDYRNHYGISAVALSTLRIGCLNIEHADSLTQTNPANAWQVTQADIYDISNYLRGEIGYKVTKGGTGNDNTFVTSGGRIARYTNLYTAKSQERVQEITSSATPIINTDETDIVKITAQSTAITSMTSSLSGTPKDGEILEIQVTATGTVGVTWGASFARSAVALPTAFSTTTLTVIFQYYTTSSYGNNKWICTNYF